MSVAPTAGDSRTRVDPIRALILVPAAAFGLSAHTAMYGVLLAGVSFYMSCRRRHSVAACIARSVTAVLFTFVCAALVLAHFGVRLDPSLAASALATVGLSVGAYSLTRGQVVHRIDRRWEIPGLVAAVSPLAAAITVAAGMNARWVGWLEWGGDFALHYWLIGYTAFNQRFVPGPSGTPVVWHVLAYLASGARSPSFETYGVLVMGTFSMLLVAAVALVSERTPRKRTTVSTLAVIMTLLGTTPISFVISGFVTTTASCAFLVMMFEFVLPHDRGNERPANLVFAAMAGALAVVIWQPELVAVVILSLAALPYVVRNLRDVVRNPSVVVGLVAPIALVTMTAIQAAHIGTPAGGAAPTLGTRTALAVIGFAFILTAVTNASHRRLAAFLSLGSALAIVAVYWAVSGGFEFPYYPRKIEWTVLALSLVLIIRGLTASLSRGPRVQLFALVGSVVLVASTALQVNMHDTDLLARKIATPSGNSPAIFVALEESREQNAPAVYFIKSGDDYIANLWVAYGLSVPSGPVDPSLRTPYDSTTLCPFLRDHSGAYVYTRHPLRIRSLIRRKCALDGTVDVRDLLRRPVH